MSKYFTSVYKNYYEKIELDKNIETNYNSLNDRVSTYDSSIKNYISSIENSNWIEKGKTELINSYLPIISNHNNILKASVSTVLNKVIFLVKNDLFNLLVELKEKDDEYCKIQDKLKLGTLDEEDIEYYKSKLDVMDKVLTNLVNDVDNKILEIKHYNTIDVLSIVEINSAIGSMDLNKTADELLQLYKKTHKNDEDDSIVDRLKAQVEENRINKMFKSSNTSKEKEEEIKVSSTGKSLDDANCIDLSLLDTNWKVINTPFNVAEYASLAYNKGIRQNSNTERYGDLCLAFSYVHASNLVNKNSSDNAESAYNWEHAGEFTDYFNDNKQETLQTIYNEVAEGKPVIMQVNGNKSGTCRHFVTVVGIKSDVKSAQEVQESDLLILDSWDGQLERMDTSSSRFMTTGSQTGKSYSGYYLRLLK